MRNKQPRFCIITITFNAEETLERTILSVLEQNYPHKEHIVIDGASKDATLDIIQKYRNQLSQVISEKDSGLYDAMNKGLKMASGDYICFLNAGDKFHSKDTLSSIAQSLSDKDEDMDVLYGETNIVDDEGKFLRARHHRAPDSLSWTSFKKGMLVCHQAFFASTKFKDITYDLRYRYSADYDWCIRILKASRNIHNTHLTLIDYLDGGLTDKKRISSLKERFRIMARYYGLGKTIGHHIKLVFKHLSGL